MGVREPEDGSVHFKLLLSRHLKTVLFWTSAIFVVGLGEREVKGDRVREALGKRKKKKKLSRLKALV